MEKQTSPNSGILDLIYVKMNNFFGTLCGIFILTIAFIVVYEIIARFIFKSPTTWVLEISIYLCVATVFLNQCYVQKEKGNIYVDVITERLCRKDLRIIEILTSILAILYIAVLIWEGGKLAIDAISSGEVSPTSMRVPVVIPLSFLPIGGILLLNVLLRDVFRLISESKTGQGAGAEKDHLPRGLVPIIFVILFTVCVASLIFKTFINLGLVILILVLLFSGMPVAFAMGLWSIIAFFFLFNGFQMFVQLPIVVVKSLDDFILVAAPLFIMTSVILMVGKVGSNLYVVAIKWIGHIPGGLAVAAIAASTLFAAMVGSSTATVATIGIIALPAMISNGYRRDFSYGVVAIGGVLGPLIPPSIFMIVLGAMTGDSVGKLFMAGMLPGLMLSGFFIIYIILYSFIDKTMPVMKRSTWKERWTALKGSFFGLITPAIILGGIYSGIFTPTEAGAVAVVYSLVISVFIYRSISFKEFNKMLRESAKITSMVLFLVAGSIAFGHIVTLMELPQKLCAYLGNLPLSHMTVLWITLFFVLFLGALMDEFCILLITYPLLYYIFVQTFKFDSIWFALVFVFTLEVGLVAPPVGINIFVVQGIDRTARFVEVVKGVFPFMLIMILSILLVVYVKPLSLLLPKLIG